MGIRKAVLSAVLIASSFSNIAFAAGPRVGSVTIKDLTSSDPAIVPTNPLYFLSQWSWGVKRLFAGNRTLFYFELAESLRACRDANRAWRKIAGLRFEGRFRGTSRHFPGE